MRALVSRLKQSLLLRNALWCLGGNGVRLFLQAIYFVLIARALGVAQYGAFVGAVALVALISPLSSWGTGFLLIKNVARDRAKFAHYWGIGFSLTVLFGCVLTILIFATARIVWGHSLPGTVLLLVALSDIVLVRILELSAQAFTAVEVLRKNSELYVVLSVARTLAAGIFLIMVRTPTASAWAGLYFASAGIAAIYSVLAVTKHFAPPILTIKLSYPDLKEGFYFAVALMSQTIYNDIDKAMLVRFSGLGATGIYGAAYRIVDASFAPVSALTYAAFPRLLWHGELGLGGSLGYAKKLIACSAAYGAAAAAALYFLAPTLPLVLGRSYEPASLALKWLSPLVLIKSVHYFLADSLTSSGHQKVRTAIQLLIVAINVLLNVLWIPSYSWRGAAWASIISDGLLLVCLWLATLFLTSRPASVITQVAAAELPVYSQARALEES